MNIDCKINLYLVGGTSLKIDSVIKYTIKIRLSCLKETNIILFFVRYFENTK